jgi:hypothetical protein
LALFPLDRRKSGGIEMRTLERAPAFPERKAMLHVPEDCKLE